MVVGKGRGFWAVVGGCKIIEGGHKFKNELQGGLWWRFCNPYLYLQGNSLIKVLYFVISG